VYIFTVLGDLVSRLACSPARSISRLYAQLTSTCTSPPLPATVCPASSLPGAGGGEGGRPAIHWYRGGDSAVRGAAHCWLTVRQLTRHSYSDGKRLAVRLR